MHFMAVASMNCHEVAELRGCDNLPLMQGTLQCIGSSLEASLDLVNHSCVPSVLRFNCGRSTVLIACKDIKEGDEVKSYIIFLKTVQFSYLKKHALGEMKNIIMSLQTLISS